MRACSDDVARHYYVDIVNADQTLAETDVWIVRTGGVPLFVIVFDSLYLWGGTDLAEDDEMIDTAIEAYARAHSMTRPPRAANLE